MEMILSIIAFMSVNWMAMVGGITTILVGIIAIALVIPGEQPEKFLQPIVDFLKKLSVK